MRPHSIIARLTAILDRNCQLSIDIESEQRNAAGPESTLLGGKPSKFDAEPFELPKKSHVKS